MENNVQLVPGISDGCQTNSNVENIQTALEQDISSSATPMENSMKNCRKSSRLKDKQSKLALEFQQTDLTSDKPKPKSGSRRRSSEEIYDLRLSSLVKRVELERRQSSPKQPKGKSRPPPLSKYRRRTANARERMRMADINEGFEALRQCLPEMSETMETKGNKEKVTKHMILTLALNYIRALRELLGCDTESPSTSGSSVASSITSTSSSVGSSCEDSDLGSDAASTRASSISSASLDDMCSNCSPISTTEVRDIVLGHSASTESLVHRLANYIAIHDPSPDSCTSLDYQSCSPISSSNSLSPSNPHLDLPDTHFDLVQQFPVLDSPISFSTLEDCMELGI